MIGSQGGMSLGHWAVLWKGTMGAWFTVSQLMRCDFVKHACQDMLMTDAKSAETDDHGLHLRNSEPR